MTYRAGALVIGGILCGVLGSSTATAQSAFRNYRCADGTQFIAVFFDGDTRAHLQLDGKAVTLTKRCRWREHATWAVVSRWRSAAPA